MCQQILCYGDSNTYGYDPRSYLDERYPKSVRWMGLSEVAGKSVINKGVYDRSISRSDQKMETAVQEIRCAKASAFVVMLGSNDLLQHPGLLERVSHL